MAEKATLSDHNAEGAPPEMPVSVIDQHMAHLPARLPSHLDLRDPKSETGIIPQLQFAGEGRDDDARQDAALAPNEVIPSPQAQPSGRLIFDTPLTALIVEDALDLAELLRATLRRMNITVHHESHGSRALTRYETVKPNLVLLDIHLPDISGWQVLERLKQIDVAMPPVIVITAFGDATNRVVGKLHGVTRYLIKPFTPAELEIAVKQVFGRGV